MRDYTRLYALYAIERNLARFYASATLGVFFLIGISDLGFVGLAWLSGAGLMRLRTIMRD